MHITAVPAPAVQEHMQWSKMGEAINKILIIFNGGKTNETAAAKSMQWNDLSHFEFD